MLRRRWYLVENNENCDVFGGEALQIVYVVDEFELFSRCELQLKIQKVNVEA